MLKLWRELNTKVQKSGLDQVLHFIVGVVVATLLYKYLPAGEQWIRIGLSIMAPIAIGVVKEITDINFDPVDLLGYAAGGVLATVIMVII